MKKKIASAGRMELKISEDEKNLMDQVLTHYPYLNNRSDLIRFLLHREYKSVFGQVSKLINQ